MKCIVARRWPCRLLGAFLALLGWACFTPGARAGCGGHVFVGNPAAHQTAGRSEQPARPAPARAPCAGPHCSKAPAAPTPAPVSRRVPAEQHGALVPAAPALPESPVSSALAETSPDRPAGAGSAIYHPPR
jgi:hypothetical protein